MVLHNLNQACRYAHQIVALNDGQVYAQGVPRQVVTEKMVRDVFRLEAHVVADPITGTPMCVPVGKAGRRRASTNGQSDRAQRPTANPPTAAG